MARQRPGGGKERREEACARCAGLEAELGRVRAQRDQVLLELARERETLNALRVPLRMGTSTPPPRAAPPLRHVVVDQVNDFFKQRLRPVHAAARLAVRLVKRNPQG